jgi:predicted transcriptional regulator
MKVVGMLTTNHLLMRLSMKKVTGADTLDKVMIRDFRNMSSGMPLPELSRVLERQNFVLVDGSSVASSYDVLNFMAEHEI